jgi:hypothetical protein
MRISNPRVGRVRLVHRVETSDFSEDWLSEKLAGPAV